MRVIPECVTRLDLTKSARGDIVNHSSEGLIVIDTLFKIIDLGLLILEAVLLPGT